MDVTSDYLESVSTIMLTCGASCPDSVINEVIQKILNFYPEINSEHEALESLTILNA